MSKQEDAIELQAAVSEDVNSVQHDVSPLDIEDARAPVRTKLRTAAILVALYVRPPA